MPIAQTLELPLEICLYAPAPMRFAPGSSGETPLVSLIRPQQ